MVKNNDYFSAVDQIIKTGHLITDQVSKELKEFKISEPQYNVLKILRSRKRGPITVQEIQCLMVQRTSNVTRIVDKLLDKGLVSRQECPSNRRKMDITITNKGEALLAQLDKKVLGFHQPMMGKLNPEEIKTLTKLIIKLKGELYNE